jgi:hypothetical protein
MFLIAQSLRNSMKRTIIAFTAALLSFPGLSQASFIFNLADPNSCDTISGHWSGTGKASNWLLGDCVYHGSGDVSTLDSTGHFSVAVNADKDSGSPFCPDHAGQTLNAMCSNGVVTIKTEFGSLSGTFTNNTGTAKGTLSVSPGLDADVSIKFTRD